MNAVSQFKLGDHVFFTCPDHGHVKGKIKTLAKCITNGEPHAVIEAEPKGCAEPKRFVQPTSTLRLA